MLAIILAAGYAKRLYPLTLNTPKPLLDISPNKPVINYIIEKLEKTEIKTVYVVTNNKFYNNFLDWKNRIKTKLSIEIVNDKTASEENKLGAVGDINFIINNKKLSEPLLIIGGDNLFDFELTPIIKYFKNNKKDVISVAEEKNIERLKQLGIVKMDNNNNKIISFEEKPENPSSELYSNCIYLYTKETLGLIKQYIREKNNPDQPGRFIQWLYNKKDILGFLNKEGIIDIGTHETLELARKQYAGKLAAKKQE